MRAILLAATAVALAIGLPASGQEKPAKPLQIGMICAGSTADGGWNQQAKDALGAVEKSLGAKATISEQVKEDRAADDLRDYARRGADLVICHGFEFLGPAQKVARAEKKTKIAVSGADPGKGYDAIVMLDIDISGPSFQAGVLAGKVSKTRRLGFIAGSEIPPVDASFRAFEAGAKSVDKDITVAKAYTSWDEPLKSKQQAEAFLQRGVDVIFVNLDTASKGVFEAVKARNAAPVREDRPTVWVIGCNSDQNNNKIAPEHTLASVVIRLDKAFEAVAKSVRDGTFKPGVHPLNLKNGETECVLNPRLVGDKSAITPEVKKAVEETRQF